MEKTNFEFLSLLKSSLKNEKYDGEKIDFEDLVYIVCFIIWNIF